MKHIELYAIMSWRGVMETLCLLRLLSVGAFVELVGVVLIVLTCHFSFLRNPLAAGHKKRDDGHPLTLRIPW